MKPSPMDACLFSLSNQKGETIGLVGVHVDDGIYCGTPKFHQKIKQLSQKFPFGSQTHTEFTFTGLNISKKENYAIHVDQSQYIRPIEVKNDRRKSPDDPITEAERQSLRAVIGSLLYAAVNTRPDLCSRLGVIQSRINNGQVKRPSRGQQNTP